MIDMERKRKIRDFLYGSSPYEGFDPEPHPPDLQGWGSDHPVLTRVIQELRPSRILEIGSWKGRSAVAMATAARTYDVDCEIICVDTWLGSPEHWLRQQQSWYDSLKIRNGLPHIYWTFLSNVVREGLQNLITPYPNTSENACYVFKQLGVYFDFCYLDAAHEYEPVKRDLRAMWDILTEPGILVGDDYISSPGVTKAADEFARERGLTMLVEPGKFMLFKGSIVPPIVL